MTLAKPKTQDTIDPNILQRQASNPVDSVWVGASAGSGKTKVLTDRILRLLLPDQNGRAGTKPHKILALTFTKAGASEMALRLNKKLSEWAISDDDILKRELNKLLGHPATPEQITSAKKLFAAVIDAPGGLKILTIHSFCTSLLSRFPIEAGLSPSFKELNETQAQKLLIKARDYILKNKFAEKGSPLSEAIHNISIALNEDQITGILANLIQERHQLQKILENHFGVDGLYNAICAELDIPTNLSEENLILGFCQQGFDETGLRNACTALSNGTPATDQPRGMTIQSWLDADTTKKVKTLNEYQSAFLTNDGDIRKNIATAGLSKKYPNITPILNTEAQRLYDLNQNINTAKTASLTRDLFLIGQEILNHYTILKEKESALDFDDLILYSLRLLQGNTLNTKGLNIAPWVRYKLDQGIDHILVDEAQDTNPEQWEIIRLLCDDFFDGSTKDDIDRTLFVVGDEKQSIFSFQRARPEKFSEMRQWFSEKIKNSGKILNPIYFITSFRSSKPVLELVDRVFENPEIRAGLGEEIIEHQSYYHRRGGLVELWPVFKNDEKDDFDPWSLPLQKNESQSAAAQLANHIASTISDWIKEKQILESYNRPIEPKDILILVRSRTAFLDQIVKSLKDKNIPVSGIDRMVLSEQLVVQDLSAAIQFSLLPEDDLNLAGLLKSPFIGWNEEQLYGAAYNRKNKTLWARIKESNNKHTIDWLSDLIAMSGKEKPYDFLSKILQKPCPADSESGLRALKKRLGNDCLDPLEEFLNKAIDFEKEEIPTLQNFIQAQLYDESEIKRQMEEESDAVRIMTVHGAKGLQAPIVILPDTAKSSTSNKTDNILWPDRSNASLPYFCPSSKRAPDKCKEIIDHFKEKQEEESRRLLYVALTRAENRLYIAGYTNYKNVPEKSWYRYVEDGFKNLDNIEEINLNESTILRYSRLSVDHEHDHKSEKETKTKKKQSDIPKWLFEPMPEEPFPPRPLIPSRPSEKESASLSPLKAQNNHRFVRGNVTHKLLQILPDLPDAQRQNAAARYVSLPSHNLPEKVQKSIVDETLAILNDHKFSAVFGEGSMAEVPVTGLMNDKTILSGQIDRLLITEKEILIVDYKTNRPPPQKLEDVPTIYKNQMRAYANALRLIYEERPVKTALIWTDGATLMEIPNQ